MRRVERFYYTFDELSPEARRFAIANLDDNEVVDDDWYEMVYADFEEKLSAAGLSGRFSFAGFSFQGSGAGVCELHADMEKLVGFLGIEFPHAALKKLFFDFVTFSSHASLWNRYYCDSESELVCEETSFLGNAPRIETFLEDAAEDATKKLDDFLNNIRKDLYKALWDAYEDLVSDASKAEYLEAMEIEFEEDGTRVA